MISSTVDLRPNGAITLPKEWRDQFPTKHFLMVETADGLLIKPIVDIQYYEEADGTVGLRFPTGIEAGALAGMLEQASKKLSDTDKQTSA
jgi:hypothetical protein